MLENLENLVQCTDLVVPMWSFTMFMRMKIDILVIKHNYFGQIEMACRRNLTQHRPFEAIFLYPVGRNRKSSVGEANEAKGMPKTQPINRPEKHQALDPMLRRNTTSPGVSSSILVYDLR